MTRETQSDSTRATVTPPTDDMLVVLDRDQCLRLVASMPVGRLAVPRPGQGPLVVPVNHVVDGDAIVFRSDVGHKLALLATTPVSFQVDDVDPVHRTGWSVLVTGVAYEATHWEIDHLLVEPWAPGSRSHWVRLVIEEVSGRRVRLADVTRPEGDLGYL